MIKLLSVVGIIALSSSISASMHKTVINILPITNVKQSEASKSEDFYKKYNLLKPNFKLDLTKPEGFLTYLLWYYETQIIKNKGIKIIFDKKTYDETKIKSYLGYKKETSFMGQVTTIKAEVVNYFNHSDVEETYTLSKEKITYEEINTVILEHNWGVKISTEVGTKIPAPFPVDVKATIELDYNGKHRKETVIKTKTEKEIGPVTFKVAPKSKLVGQLKIEEVTQNEVGYLNALIESKNKIYYQIQTKEDQTKNEKITFGQLLESVQYHNENIFNFIKNSSKKFFGLVDTITDNYIKDKAEFVKVQIPSRWSYQKLENCVYKENKENVMKPLIKDYCIKNYPKVKD